VYDGVPLRFPRRVGDGLLWSLCRYGTRGFEPDAWGALRTLLADAKVFLDVGSNIGFYSILARKIAPTVEIIAFEPLPSLCAAHRLFCEANGVSVELAQLALSDVNGTTALYLPKSEGSELSTATLTKASWQARKPHEEISVRIIKLDSFLACRQLQKPVVIKIDVEDHEAAVLRGAAETIRRYRPMIVCEILPRPLRDPSKKDDDRTLPEQHENRATVAAIDMLGYVSFAINTNNYVRFTAEDFARPRSCTDFLLIPREHDPRADVHAFDRTG
jgi:FkbM family methyltransferase